ncbi:MAG TPA: carbohydrate ABC transporter permease [Chloroflexota bacterium]|nr:carbohydrate ABC transporter permease [Chloroflexota bacterium]
MRGQSLTAARRSASQNTVAVIYRRALRLSQYLLVVLLPILFMGPFFWTVASSLKRIPELHTYPPVVLPAIPQWSNYVQVRTDVPFGLWVLNSTIVVVLSVLGTVISASAAAFSFARFRHPGHDVLFLLMLGTMMLPVEVTIIPSYLMFFAVGWLNTLLPLIVPSFFGGGAFFVFLLRQFFLSIPPELDEAAIMDGAGWPTIFWQIVMPLSRPALATVAVIAFISHWEEFMQPLIYLHSESKFTLAIGLRYFQDQAGYLGTEPRENLLMAAAVMAPLPSVLLFFMAQRYFVQGVVMTGIKG